MKRVILTLIGVCTLVIVFVASCGSTTTTTTVEEEERPPVTISDPAISQTFNAFTPNDNGDGVDAVVKVNGAEVNDGDNVVANRGNPTVQITTAIYGLGVYDPELRDRQARLNITDTRLLPEQEPICSVTVQKDTDLPIPMNPSNMKEVVASFNLSKDQKDYGDAVVFFSVTGAVDAAKSLVWTARRMGLQPMPSSGGTTITTTTVTRSGNNDWVVAGIVGLAGLAIGAFTGNPGLGLAIACGDPHEVVQFSVTIPGRLGDTEPVTPPPPSTNHNPTLDPTGPTTLKVDQSGTWSGNATDQDGDVLSYKWFIDGSLVATTPNLTHVFTVPGTYLVRLEVRDGKGGFAFYEWSVVVSSESVDEYAGATVSITPLDPFLDPLTPEPAEQQFVVRIFGSDTTTLLPVPTGATVVWSSNPDGFIDSTGYFYSVFALNGAGDAVAIPSIVVTCTITWPGHELSGISTVSTVQAGS